MGKVVPVPPGPGSGPKGFSHWDLLALIWATTNKQCHGSYAIEREKDASRED
jgi:hypothetical protein